jgi:hypothetical protein
MYCCTNGRKEEGAEEGTHYMLSWRQRDRETHDPEREHST